RLADLVRYCPAVRLRRARSLGQAKLGIGVVAVDPLVGCFPTDLIALREFRHRPFVVQPVGDERHALIHRAGLLPGHSSGSPPDCPSNLLPMYPVYSVTNLSGSDRRVAFPSPVPPSRWGKHADGVRDPDGMKQHKAQSGRPDLLAGGVNE